MICTHNIVAYLKHLLLILPLWTCVLPRKLNSPSVVAYVESEMGNLKNNLPTKSQRIDDFVKEYLEVCDRATITVSSIHLMKSNMKLAKKFR